MLCSKGMYTTCMTQTYSMELIKNALAMPKATNAGDGVPDPPAILSCMQNRHTSVQQAWRYTLALHKSLLPGINKTRHNLQAHWVCPSLAWHEVVMQYRTRFYNMCALGTECSPTGTNACFELHMQHMRQDMMITLPLKSRHWPGAKQTSPHSGSMKSQPGSPMFLAT